MPELLTNVPTADGYTNAATIGPAVGVAQLTFQAFNQPIYVRLFKPIPDRQGQPIEELVERYFPAGALVQFSKVCGAQFRSANPGSPATINAELAFDTDPVSSYSSTGLFSSAVLSLAFDHNAVPQGSESTVDFTDTGTIAWTLTDTPGVKMVVSAALVTGSFVSSVFGRTGAVTAQSGDYTAAQVTNAADLSSASAQVFTGNVSAPALIPSGLTGSTSATRFVGGTASGAPSSGAHSVGDVAIAQNGHVFVCTVAGTPGTWVDAGSVGNVVTSVFGRTGAVTANTGDYSAAQVTNAADLSSASQQSFTGEVKAPDFTPAGLTGSVQATRWVGATASGAPTTGAHNVGDWVVARNGHMFVCTAAGTPGTWVDVGSVGNLVTSVFGRTGAVTAQSGDYTAAQVTNAADLSTASTQTFTGIITGPEMVVQGSAATIGFAAVAGTGGSVTQITSRSTAVTINKACGTITTASTNESGWKYFTVNNSTIIATDTIILTCQNGDANLINLFVFQCAAGSFQVAYQLAALTSVAYKFNFSTIQAVNS